MRQYPDGDPIRVHTDSDGEPMTFIWHGETHCIETVEDIREPQLDWWSPTGEIHRVYYLVTTNRHLICELYRDVPAAAWYISRVYD
jgi:hypothetical protein